MRRPCPWLDRPECQHPQPPRADFPHGWPGFADVLHVDFKVPSEHLISGKRYDAELQTFHLNKEGGRIAVQATLIEATADGFNWYFDDALKAFDVEFDRDYMVCAMKKRRGRQLVRDFQRNLGIESPLSNKTDYEIWGQYSLESDSPGFKEKQETIHRELQSGVWNPHHPMLELSIYFYGYEGSLTEPPCFENVSWFVTDKPMKISFQQLAHLKNLIFNHIDQNCQRTSVHYRESVARPIQNTADRPVYHCTSANFGPDP